MAYVLVKDWIKQKIEIWKKLNLSWTETASFLFYFILRNELKLKK